jgi:signal recognition particle receptor subunit beta
MIDSGQSCKYVIDSNDAERLDEAKELLHNIMSEDAADDSVLLVLANKQDLPNAKSPIALSVLLELHTVKQNYREC